jgi:tRNA modification GTPase
MDTIFAPITARGGAVTVVRISGERVAECLRVLGVRENLEERKASVCKLVDAGDVAGTILDEAMLVRFVAPRSFTGEDVCELNLHSSSYVVGRVMKILSGVDGVRMAEPGEFSKRAFLNNKIDLTQAEGICDLITSETAAQQKQAMAQLQGSMKNFYDGLRASTVEILSNVEAYIDFPEEDIPEDVILSLGAKVEKLRAEVAKHLEDGKVGEKIREGIFIAILGSPNVGKSSLLNFLAKRDVAIVSEIEGTTRDVLEVSLDLNGLPVIVSDTAGLRETVDVIEAEGVKRAMRKSEEADLKVVMLEAEKLGEWDKISHVVDEKTLIVVNKVDLAGVEKRVDEFVEMVNAKGSKRPILQVSVKSDEGMKEFMKTLQTEAEKVVSGVASPLITRERHRVALQEAYDALGEFSLDKGIELAGEDLRIVASAIGRITGKIGVDEVLDSVFSKFCLGK